MEECCICLASRKCSALQNLLKVDIETLCSFSAMIYFLTNIKINENWSLKICRLCIKNLKEAYEFKKKVLNSYLISDCNESDKSKIYFNTIEELKQMLQINENYLIPKSEYLYEDIENTLQYNDVSIHKVAANNVMIKQEPIPILDFLNVVDEEICEDILSDPDYDMDLGNLSNLGSSDEEYSIPLNQRLKVKKTKRKKQNLKNRPQNVPKPKMLQKAIKPVLLPFVRLKKAKPKSKIHNKENKKQKFEICPYCGKSMRNLNIHLRMHTEISKDFACSKCDKRYYAKCNLIKHEKSHLTEREFKCEECTASFIDKPSLKNHMTLHSDVKEHVCSVCQRAYKRKNHLLRHILTHSGGSKTISCEQCKLSFYTKANLRHHMRVHTGERPYNCEMCHQPYSYKRDFTRHCLRKHGVFLKRRNVCIMNQEVLLKEKEITRELIDMSRGDIGEATRERKEFRGPDGVLALNIALRDLKNEEILKYVLL